MINLQDAGYGTTGNDPALEKRSLPSVKPVPRIPEDLPLFDEFTRTSSGASVVEPDSVAWENGRTYHGYKEGKYHLPNDAVCFWPQRHDGPNLASCLLANTR